ncbi:hypothetical protein [Novosphingobium sp. TH158]|uniref:hypothetical protein n=1 Tax=Novosphingobium sp. TH158 TaxID=2067455 RepID=UPI000C7C1B5B|nr:hypothetical protein [Novosphingobium sp. TH158]PLK26596.1 hypothetical protein C0V78_06595 [Novosphingobium sp. TH158]
MKKAVLALAVLALPLAGCGVTAPLKPQAGKDLPVAPLGRDTRPTSDELLKLRPQAAPERTVELRSKSEDRADDPYDLPPEG